MIKLSLDDYCQDCNQFEPVAKRTNDTVYSMGGEIDASPSENFNCIHVICEHTFLCRRLARHLKKANLSCDGMNQK